MPPSTSATAASTASSAGMPKLRRKLSSEVLRQASKGPTAVSSRRKIAMGTFTRLKNGGPTVTLLPVTHSERIGNSVPHSTAKHETNRRRLLNRKLDSRETSDSSRCSLFRCERFFTKKNRQTVNTIPMNVRNQLPMEDCAKAWTELTTPLRVRNVPSSESRNVEKMSHTFHTFIMPRFSCIITECRKAVPVSQGSSDAFSTGSHIQYPPHPSTA